MKNNRFTKKLSALLLSACVVLTALPLSGIIASADDTAALPKIWLDAGHGGSDPGAMNGDRHEADDNLRVTLAVGEKLEAAGFELLQATPVDMFPQTFHVETVSIFANKNQ